MNFTMIRGARLTAAAALLGAIAVAPVGAADWDSLNSSSWGGSAAADSTGMATADRKAHYGVEIANAFESLGMSAARAECYGKVLVSQLSADEQQQAAELVRTASNSEDVRSNVMSAGPNYVGGFTAANESCPESL